MTIMKLLIQLVVGIVLSGLIGFAAYRRGSLTQSGALGAMTVGTAIFGFGGLAWGLLLITFFVTSSMLSHYKEPFKEKLAEKFAKGHQRDIGQALANGGAGALIALASLAFADRSPMLAAFVGAMATVNADTWATELGVLNRQPPRLITTWQVVEPGTSGGVSLLGLLAKVGGALLIGLAALLFLFVGNLAGSQSEASWLLIPAALAGGLAGAYFDSLLGATVQAIYYCPVCEKETERTPRHLCGAETHHKRGWLWLNNDMVNFVSSLVGALVAVGVWQVLT
jgi:uncharacterized protein (TIGR00297 family)